MPSTAFQHFTEDVTRAIALVDHGDSLPQTTPEDRMLRSDMLRSGWMFAVGALDAFFCDAYTWVVGGSLIAKDREPTINLPSKLLEISLPITAYLGHYAVRGRWRWRMAARRMMDDRNMLNLGAIEGSFKPFLPPGQKLYQDVIVSWVAAADAKQRIFGVTSGAFSAMTPQQRNARRNDFIKAMRHRFDSVVIQRRHDCIHNCDRPKSVPQSLNRAGTVRNVVRDVRFLGEQFNNHLEAQFPVFLRGLGFSAATVQAATN